MFPLDEILPVMENIPIIKKANITPKTAGTAPPPRPAIFHPLPWYTLPEHVRDLYGKPFHRAYLNGDFSLDTEKALTAREYIAIGQFCIGEEQRILSTPFFSDIYGSFAGDSRVLSEFEKQQILGQEMLHSLMNQFSSGILPLLLNSTPPGRNEMFLQTPPPLSPIPSAMSPLPKTPLPVSEVQHQPLDLRVTPPHMRALFSPSPIVLNSNDCCASPHVSLVPVHTPVSPLPQTPFPIPIPDNQQSEPQRSIFSPPLNVLSSPDCCTSSVVHVPLTRVPSPMSPLPKTPLPIFDNQQTEQQRSFFSPSPTPIALNSSLSPISPGLSLQQETPVQQMQYDIPQDPDIQQHFETAHSPSLLTEYMHSPSLLTDYAHSPIPSDYVRPQSPQFSIVNHESEYDATAYDLANLIIPQSKQQHTESSTDVEKPNELTTLLTNNIVENNDDFSFGTFYADLFDSSNSHQQQQTNAGTTLNQQHASSVDTLLSSAASTSTATLECDGFQQSSEHSPSADVAAHDFHQLQTRQEHQQQQQVQHLFEQHQQQQQELKRIHQEQQRELQEFQQFEVLNFHQSSAIVFHPLQQEQPSHSANNQQTQQPTDKSSSASVIASSQLQVQTANNASSSLSIVNVKYFLNGSVVNYSSAVFQPTVNIITDKHDLIPSVEQVFEKRRSVLREKRERAKWIKIIKREKKLYFKELYQKRKAARLAKLSDFTDVTANEDDIWGDSDAYSSESEDESVVRKRRVLSVKVNNFVFRSTREERHLSDVAWIKQKHCVLAHHAPITKISSLGISIFISSLDVEQRRIIRHWTKSRLEREATEFLKKYNCDLLSSLNTLAIRLSVDFHLMVFNRELELLAKSRSKIHNVLCVVKGHHGFFYPVTNYIGLFNQRRRASPNKETKQ